MLLYFEYLLVYTYFHGWLDSTANIISLHMKFIKNIFVSKNITQKIFCNFWFFYSQIKINIKTSKRLENSQDKIWNKKHFTLLSIKISIIHNITISQPIYLLFTISKTDHDTDRDK